MPIIPSIFNFLNTRRLSQIDLFRKYPVETQKNTIFHLIEKASLTEWGVKHKYSSISSVKEYQERVPLQTYDDLLPYVERLGRGETGLSGNKDK